jgi:hypothetical protein
MKSNEIKNKKGQLTRYGFLCGYMEVKEIDDDNRIMMHMESNGSFQIKGYKKGKHVWMIIYSIHSIAFAREVFETFFEIDYPDEI